MIQYILCEFQYGHTGRFYIENTDSIFSRFLDLNGIELILPGCGEDGFVPYGYIIIETDPIMPF
jgi:hypothetical protein